MRGEKASTTLIIIISKTGGDIRKNILPSGGVTMHRREDITVERREHTTENLGTWDKGAISRSQSRNMTFNRALLFKTAEVGGGGLPFLGPFNAGADLSTTSSIQVKFFEAIQGGVVRANRRSPTRIHLTFQMISKAEKQILLKICRFRTNKKKL